MSVIRKKSKQNVRRSGTPRRFVVKCVLLLLTVMSLYTSLYGDVVRLSDGRTIECIARQQGDKLIVERNGLKAMIPMSRVVGVEKRALPQPAEKTVAPPKVEVVKTAEGFRLLRGGKPYFVRGAGGSGHFDLLVECGGNSVRTWGVGGLGGVLKQAAQRDVTVAAGIWIQGQSKEFDYGDEAAVQGQLETSRQAVRRFRNHPALLLWGIGNEVHGDGKDPRFWKAVNEIAKMIHQEDPNHPTMTVVAFINPTLVRQFQQLCPDVDVLGINQYGGLATLPSQVMNCGLIKPYIVTEFGPKGHWEVRRTVWGAPIEPTSTDKAETYLSNYTNSIARQQQQCLGSYVFLWGQKQEMTGTWFGMFVPSGEKTSPVDVMSYAWSNKWPKNRCPRLVRLESSAKERMVKPGETFSAQVIADDVDGDALTARWEVRQETKRASNSGERAPTLLPECILTPSGLNTTVRAPDKEGPYRLFGFVYDGQGNAATANFPFYVGTYKPRNGRR